MKKHFLLILSLLLMQNVLAQTKTISGKVLEKGNETGIPGVTIKVEGTNTGTQTDIQGIFQIQVPENGVIVASFIGYETQRIQLDSRSQYEIQMQVSSTTLSEVVVTALGISREKRSLGYSSQQLDGDNLTTASTGNVTSALSGKVSGVQIRTNTGIGGSANIVIRGNKSLTGDNQALYVIDGVPVDNSNASTSNNSYDYGNLASDLNPDDIESLNILKGAAATALYGSRAANGAIIVTTKKGSKKVGLGLSVSSGVTIGIVDKNTFPKYQQSYGAGYGALNGADKKSFFNSEDVNGDGVIDLVSPYMQYAGFGAAYDPNLMVYQFDSFYPESPNYKKASPWVPTDNGPITLFKKGFTSTNNIALAGNNKQSSYRLSYSNYLENGTVPSSSLKRHSFSLNSSFKLSEKLTASALATYTISKTRGRSERGSGSSFSNFMVNMRQYWQPNVDMGKVRSLYETTGKNLTQFPGGTIDNPYYLINENQQSDDRTRFVGNASLNYKVTKWLDVLGRISADSYSYLMEERQNTLNRVPARYTVRNNNFQEINYDLMANYNFDIAKNLNMSGVVGTNIRRNKLQSIYNATNGGLIVSKLYSISNSVGTPPPAVESFRQTGVNGYFATVSLGYKHAFYLDITSRVDQSSTLPSGSNAFFYPSIAGSFVFSEYWKTDFLSFGKIRINYAEVGNSAQPLSLVDVLTKPVAFGTTQLYSVNSTKNNPTLKPENTESFEAGIETSFLMSRLGLNLSVYRTNTINQIMPVAVTAATGYTNKYVNAGALQNKGLEITLTGKILAKTAVKWDVNVNWSANRSKVLSLYDGVTNLSLGSFSTDMSLNATIGQPYGTWFGSDYEYIDGKPVVDQTTGKYKKTTSSKNILGNMNPDWIGGVTNTVSYKGLSLKFLVDMQQGGDIFSEDMAVGSRNGLYENTVGINDLGNPVRNPIAQGGGIILNGVTPDGAVNTVRTEMVDRNHALGIPTAPSAMYLYDASYVKLREVSLSYSVPTAFVKRLGLFAAQFSLVGSNLWIIHKNLPNADPEAGLGSGNLQGFQTGVFPTTRNFGANLKLTF
ncbi:SusC/RagA family TonB-linked outer membrane protein [Dyadobacter psychrotolerans]|uniref:SusC/RagA family TonB-linked outer membrane protein n=1 Tax=Dyadobacter psychrotolerans TaxID=2541721 RepID=A0A4R5DUF8_9BACT|nr:SusC/RagA family TonB-linked outer membrane protein [Dyadobacter psychrotolerans]TDE14835.1 SusC/RagA family TonB-linked outer membrane protein [Dyadobacter psychrotolerans]